MVNFVLPRFSGSLWINLVGRNRLWFLGHYDTGFDRLFPEKGKTGSKLPVLMLFAGLLFLAADFGGVQYYSLLAIPLLLLYSGKRGKANLKYFFYIFYPVHLAVLQGIAWIVR